MFILIFKSSMSIAFKKIDKNIEEALKPFKDVYDKANKWFSKQDTKKLHIKSFDNLNLSALYVKNKKNKGLIILAHGYRSNIRRDLYASCSEYYKMGYSLLLVNLRGCESEGKYITFGVKESRDINSWIDYMNKEYKYEKIILGGISLGASSILMVNNDHVRAIISDSPFASAYDELNYVIKHYFHLPAFIFMPMINLYAKFFADADINKANVVDNINKINVPILFIHGLSDEFIPHVNTILLYTRYKKDKDILLIKDSDHGMGYLVDRDAYINKIKSFIKVNKI